MYKFLKKQNGSIKVGFFKEDKYPDGKSVAEVAAFNEFGGLYTPPRPFMRDTSKKFTRKWIKAVRDLLPVNMDGKETLGLLGDEMVEDMQFIISTYMTPPNAPSTIKRKGRNDPLVDTKHMMNSVKWKGDWV